VTDSPLKWSAESLIEVVRRWFHRQKLIYDQSADPLLLYFSFFFPIPTLSYYKQPAPLQKKKNSPFSLHKFFKFCGHNIRILIYQQILLVFVSNSIFLNFNI